MIIETVVVTGLVAITLYGGTRWLRAGVNQHDAKFRRDILQHAAEIAAGDDPSALPEIAQALLSGQARTKVLRVECVLRKLSPSQVECKTVVALPHSQGVVRRSTTRVFEWDELPSQVRSDFIRHGNEEQVYLMFDNSTESKEHHVS